MNRRLSAECFRIIAAGLALAISSVQAQTDTGDPALAASAVSPPIAADFSSDSDGNPTLNRPHRRTRHSTQNSSSSDGGGALVSSWPSLTHDDSVNSTAATPAPERVDGSSKAPIANTFSRPATESRGPAAPSPVSDWMPSHGAQASSASGSITARLDLIAKKYGSQATIDYNSRVQEPNGVIAFRAIDNQTGARETIRIDRSGEIQLKSGWSD